MKEKIYPELPTIREQPTAPEEGGHSYRLKVISDVQKFLEDEIQKRDAFYKKYSRVSRIILSTMV